VPVAAQRLRDERDRVPARVIAEPRVPVVAQRLRDVPDRVPVRVIAEPRVPVVAQRLRDERAVPHVDMVGPNGGRRASQLALPEAACKLVYATDGYSASIQSLNVPV
jgi:hypothetical protein